MPVNRIDDITIIIDSSGWEVLYWNSKKVLEGSPLDAGLVLRKLGYKVTEKEYLGKQMNFPVLLSDIPCKDL